jgi:RHS repeat-associated protein
MMVNGELVSQRAYDDRTRVETDALGNTTTWTYDEWENLTGITYPDGTSVSYEYDTSIFKITKKVDERGIVTIYEYDEKGNLLKNTQGPGTGFERETEYTHDEYGNILTQKILGDENTEETLTVMEYDQNGNLNYMKDPEGNETRITSFDALGNPTTLVDARGKTWQFGYDAQGKITSGTDPDNNTRYIYYENTGKRERIVDEENRETVYEYDDSGNLLKIITPDNQTYSMNYDDADHLLRFTDPEGKSGRFEYDGNDRMNKVIDGNGNATSFVYGDGFDDSCATCSGATGDKIERINFPTFSRAFQYDARGMKILEKDIVNDTLSHESHFSYDGAGNIVSQIDKEGKTTGYDYDGLGRISRMVDAKGNSTLFAYDRRDNLIRLEDAKGQVTNFEYDKNNRLKKEIRPMGEETLYSYDAAGNLIEKIDPKNQRSEYIYDDTRHLTMVRCYGATDHATPVKTVTFTYDKSGKLESYIDGTTSASYSYDGAGRKNSETINYGPFSKIYSYSYYKNGLKKTYTNPDGIAYGYLYDNNNQLTGIQILDIGFITINAYAWTRPSEITLPGGAKKTYEYDPLMRLNSLVVKDPGDNDLMRYQYDYDKMNNIQNKNTEHGNYNYTYDELYQLTGSDNPVLDDEAFTYDDVGNRKTTTGVTGVWVNNENNELLGYTDVTYAYDDNGNMIRKVKGTKVTSYIYNIEDRIVAVWDGEENTGTLIAEYYYDPFGRRLYKGVGGVNTYFHYRDEGLVGEYDTAGTEIKTYGWNPGSMWGTDPVFMKLGTDYYYYHNDHLGTPMQMTDVSGTVVWKAQYKAFGEGVVDIETVENNLRFPGQYFDAETGLYYNWHRYYDPEVGRYVSADPIGLASGVNLYGYGLNNPKSMIDPDGNKPVFDFDLFREKHEIYSVGRKNTWVPEGGIISRMFEDMLPWGRQFGINHDKFVGDAVNWGVPDLVCNVPSMPFVFAYTIFKHEQLHISYEENEYGPEFGGTPKIKEKIWSIKGLLKW